MRSRLALSVTVGWCVLSCSGYGSVVTAEDAGADVHQAAPASHGLGAHLTDLKVTASNPSDPAVALVPAFSPFVFDYYVRCAARENALTVSMTAAEGATAAVTLPETSHSASHLTRSLRVHDDHAIVVTATAGYDSNEYWVRCLPAEFPQLLMVQHPDAPAPLPGYYLVGNSGTTPGFAMIIDSHGVPVWYYETLPAGVEDVDHVVDDAITFFPTWSDQALSVRRLNPVATTHVSPAGTTLDTHELRVLPSGHYLVLSTPLVTGVCFSGIGRLVGFGPSVGSVGGCMGAFTQMFDCEIVEFDPKTAEVFWTWTASSHFDPLKDTQEVALDEEDGVQAVDAYHCNSIDVDPSNGNLLVSSRAMNSIFYIDRSTGSVVWKMGGAPDSLDDAIYVPVADPFMQQHDARLQPGWSAATGKGQVSVFDDESGTSSPARGLVLDVNTGLDGSPPGATVAWQYKATKNSSNRGSFRISPDGSRVIGWGNNGSHGRVFTEVDEAGRALVDFDFTDGNVSYRAIKAPLEAFDLGVLRRTCGLH